MKSDLKLIMESWRRFLKEDSEIYSADGRVDMIDPMHYDPEYGEPEGVTPVDPDLTSVQGDDDVSIEYDRDDSIDLDDSIEDEDYR